VARKVAGLKKTSNSIDVFSVVLVEREAVVVSLIGRMELFGRDDDVRQRRIERIRLERPIDGRDVEAVRPRHRLLIQRGTTDDIEIVVIRLFTDSLEIVPHLDVVGAKRFI